MAEPKYRLVTRSDFDGLVCAALLRSRGLVDEIQFAHPKDVQDGKVTITGRDITTNLPYSPDAHLVFDHHVSEAERLGGQRPANLILLPSAPSAARVVYEHFGGAVAFPGIAPSLMAAVDKADSARFTREDVLDPHGWVLLGFIMDARTGLGRTRTFTVSNYQLMMEMIGHVMTKDAGTILSLPNVAERVAAYREQEVPFKEQLTRCTTEHGHLAVVGLKDEDPIYSGNRFLVYALFPQCSISMHVMWGLKKQNTVFAIGKSIFNRTSRTHVGNLCLEYGGGGHDAAGTCQVANERADEVQAELIARIRADG